MLSLVSPLVQDQSDQPDVIEDTEDFSDEQGLVARFIQHLEAENADQQYIVNISAI